MPPCPHCNVEIDQNARFCSSCGKKLITPDVTREIHQERLHRDSQSRVVWLYGILLLICVLVKFIKFEPGWKVMTMVEVILSGVVIIFVLLENRDFITRSFAGKYNWWMFPLVIIAAVSFSFLVHLISGAIHRLNDDVFYMYMYDDTSHPVLWSALAIAVQPAIIEELAFRGIIFDRLTASMDAGAALIVSSLLFSILHLSPISLIWLVPIAVFAAWLKIKNGHIVYGMIFHFTYNLSIVLRESYERGFFNQKHIPWIH